MKKTIYSAPTITVTHLTAADGIMTVLSGGETLGYGGDTATQNITDSDVKIHSYNVWDDDWSE